MILIKLLENRLDRRGYGLIKKADLQAMAYDLVRSHELLHRALHQLEYVSAHGTFEPNPKGCDGDPQITYDIMDIRRAVQ